MGLIQFVKPTDPFEWRTSFTFVNPEGGATIHGETFGSFEGTFPHDKRIPLMGAIQESFKRVGSSNPRAVERAVTDFAELEALINDDVAEDLVYYGASGRVTVTLIVREPAGERVAQAEQPSAPTPAFVRPAPPVVPAPVVTHQPEPIVDSLNVTAEGVMSPLAMGPVLPFRQGEPARAPAPLAPAPSPDAGATAFVPVIDDLEVLPFSDELPELTVEQYASLCVERALDPSSQPEVAKRYQVLTEEALRALDARWGRRFDEEGALYQRWQQAYAQYRAWLEAQKR